MLKLETKIQLAEVVHTGPELVLVCAQLRADCETVGHALAQREHNADRWIAATAIRLGIPLVSNDRIFRGVPGLALEPIEPA
jgi:predicted nucleic acid-binding protein